MNDDHRYESEWEGIEFMEALDLWEIENELMSRRYDWRPNELVLEDYYAF